MVYRARGADGACRAAPGCRSAPARAQGLLLGSSSAVLAALALGGVLHPAQLDALGAARSAALLIGELSRSHGTLWQGAEAAAPLCDALLACTRLLAAANDGGAGTTSAALRAVCALRPLAAGEAGLAVRRAQRTAEGALAAGAHAPPLAPRAPHVSADGRGKREDGERLKERTAA